MVDPRVQMKRPSRSAESEYRVIPREFTRTVAPSFGLGAVLTTGPIRRVCAGGRAGAVGGGRAAAARRQRDGDNATAIQPPLRVMMFMASLSEWMC